MEFVMDDIIYCCKLRDESHNPDLAAELLTALDYQFSSWEDRDEQMAFHTIYCANMEEAKNAKFQVESLHSIWKEMGIEIKDIEIFEMKKEDWSEVWKKYFNILHITERLVIKPSWLEYEPKPEQVIIELDPGMSFGTGHHATTSYCLKTLDRLAGRKDICSFLDAGCGSGILSIAAAKLGYGPIDAFDIDPDAIKVSNENFEINKLAKDAVNISVADVGKFEAREGGYDLVAANILGHILKANREKIVSYVKPGGHLILAGILHKEFEDMARVFCELGMKMSDSYSEKEWTSGLFVKQ
jgi:ribosomal protein L11 methyltransferase